jgi:hypothetical protein
MNHYLIILLLLLPIFFVQGTTEQVEPYSQNEIREAIHLLYERNERLKKTITKQKTLPEYPTTRITENAGFIAKSMVHKSSVLYRKLICIYLI